MPNVMKEAWDHFQALDGKLTDSMLSQAIAEYEYLYEMIKSLEDQDFNLFKNEIYRRLEDLRKIEFYRSH